MNTPAILIIDDDPDVTYALSRAARHLGYAADSAATIHDALQKTTAKEFDAVFLDVQLPDGSGMDIISDIMNQPAHPELIIITGNGDPEAAELAISSGAWDYVEKGDSIHVIMDTLSNALEYRSDKLSSRKVRQIQALRRENIIGESNSITRCLEQVGKLAESDMNVLLTGETGTGKELFARALHNNSPRHKGPFIVVDCAALPENLVETLLFGHEKGTFTGALHDKEGLILQANNGTLFLDEVGELPLSTQKAFLRVLQERTVRPLGSKKEIPCNFRLVSATNRDLDAMQQEHTFRTDLAFRLCSAKITLPPLRERREDIALLIDHYMTLFFKKNALASKAFNPSVLTTLEDYDWPGNVRELVNAVEFIVSTSRNESRIFIKHLPPALRARLAKNRITPSSSSDSKLSSNFSYEVSNEELPTMQEHRNAVIEKAEHSYLTQLLNSTKGSIKQAVELSGLSQSRLYALLKKHRIK
ncbi:sigma-54 dependent transcriptional regulator [Halodesulfovibrio sp.]|jgi:two-component system NtrC family response regulator|uniref:sigma-54-dependent transcriptional regulator n=1 Tax=Halodesulfovibrio sp. TaxID=1912772 RepID=UPI0025FB81E0|nr:sigma-54 dependent transcriptional regulator [Halodesulfovibrio sp.]MCT4627391.1 sigma-54 dependent transcriptional regulator [Halodesulfovibrio sp.]